MTEDRAGRKRPALFFTVNRRYTAAHQLIRHARPCAGHPSSSLRGVQSTPKQSPADDIEIASLRSQ
jgi:hypothetical protein